MAREKVEGTSIIGVRYVMPEETARKLRKVAKARNIKVADLVHELSMRQINYSLENGEFAAELAVPDPAPAAEGAPAPQAEGAGAPAPQA